MSPADNPRNYLDGCQQLVDLYLKAFFPQQIPLVVNTMGWVTGLGLSVLQHLLHLLPTTHIVAFSNGEAGPYDYVQQSLFEPSPFSANKEVFKEEDVPNVAYLDPAEASGGPSSRLLRYNPAEMRSFTFWTYFMGKYSQEHDEMRYESKFTSFKSAHPFCVPIDQIKLVFPNDTVLPKGLDLLALNLAVVGLAHWDGYKHVTIAVGLVRSIDMRKRLFYILTPLGLDRLSQVTAFVVGALRIPPSILCLVDNADGPYLSYANYLSNTGSGIRKTRNNIGRKWTSK
jgi:polynucleotide 5'-hydroxyl-kinase GRC3/NOL9